jgi:hypothetical protein
MAELTNATLEDLAEQEYKYGFVTDIEADSAPPGLNEQIVRLISAKKNEPDWLLEWRLKALRRFLELLERGAEPTWAMVDYPTINFQDIIYYSAPKPSKQLESLDEVDPELLATYEKLGISLSEQKRLAGVAVDAVFDSVSVATTFKKELEKQGLLLFRGGAGVPGARPQVPGIGGPLRGQLLRGAQLGGLQRRLVRLHPEGRALPDGALHLLPDQRGRNRPVRAHADRCG